ncbi:putative cardiolipin synthase 1 [Trichinella britovi]|uniref:cardiolipin synthase (CMP-forming) n=1 Tax=Trichinella britovi TaxID=45882 RepID=A0A0V1CUK7_TRIBR|nr:putative cardiolipin synthase 1 [Trichinella britovi]KRZ93134.1 putative cardiolipin synthase 1 [Trichinella sp. T8]
MQMYYNLQYQLLKKYTCPTFFNVLRYAKRSLWPFHLPKRETRPLGTIPTNRKDSPYTVPNLLSICRIAASPVLVHLIINGHFSYTLSLFTVAATTDILDGYIARRFPTQRSTFGSIIDPLADKILVASMFLSLTYCQMIPALLTIVVIARDVCLITTGLYLRLSTMRSFDQSLGSVFHFSTQTVKITPTILSKINTFMQFALVTATLIKPIGNYDLQTTLNILSWITGFTTVTSGIQYAFSKTAFQMQQFQKEKTNAT